MDTVLRTGNTALAVSCPSRFGESATKMAPRGQVLVRPDDLASQPSVLHQGVVSAGKAHAMNGKTSLPPSVVNGWVALSSSLTAITEEQN
jgi:hypothetical protein